jgi:2-polyprenyl-3-methyl-5-hydroxy-6-metoxy-1,4-benzoquinol methylase
MNKTNPIFNLLLKLNLIKKKNLEIFSNETRDINIKVLSDKVSKVIFLEKIKTNNLYYRFKKKMVHGDKIKVFTKDKTIITKRTQEDKSRFNNFKKYVIGKDVCDFGCGNGSFLKLINKYSKYACGIELYEEYIRDLKSKYLNVFKNIKYSKKKFDTIFLFHVLEHFTDPVQELKKIKKFLKKNGSIIVEVPHGNDFLLRNCDKFKKFSLWSEHLILHTEKSLTKFIKIAGYKKIEIKYFQRYNYLNHLHWLNNGQPNGNIILRQKYDKNIDKSYNKFLNEAKMTDTIYCIAKI